MPTDNERREVARRLREVQGYVIPGTKTEVHPIAGRIIGVACGYELPDFQGLLGRLADLIEPSEPEDMTIGESAQIVCDFIAKNTPRVDRDALLALADEMDAEKNFILVGGYGRRIRQALGVNCDEK